ncbi:MAG: PBP1A family penicillin-binding protein [Anaerolineales bacterium]|nr:PBP1A family penicillin-binding protein [Anaerolineales bacterium]
MPEQNYSEPEDTAERFRRLMASEEQTRVDLPVPGQAEQEDIETYLPAGETTPPLSLPALDKNNMPLPRRVDEIDMGATRVTPAAYTHPPQAARPPVTRPPVQPPGSINWRKHMGCFARGMVITLFVFVLVGLMAGSYGMYRYYKIAKTLNGVDVGGLRERAAQFETTRIFDRNGNLLYEIIDPHAGKRSFVSLDEVSPALVAATIATEDKEFYSHPGFDPWALLRALWQNYTSGEIVSGASTITQQLARMLLLPDERFEQSYERKAREIILAAEINRRYSKDEILELYLNESFYGNHAYGVEAAAETYFNTTAGQLTISQAAFLAGLPQSPAVYDIYTNREATLKRQQQVLVLMFLVNQERGCIEVSNSEEPVCVDAAVAAIAAGEMKDYDFPTPDFTMRYPHWVNYIRSLLEEQYDPQTIYRSGFAVYTTLDPELQDTAQRMITEQVAILAEKNVSNGALVAIDPSTGEILAMVGSPDFYNEAISGQVNMATTQTRQPGSSIKPINYAAAFEKGWTPATLIWDVPSEFPPSGNPDDTREPYKPVNYDGKFHGPVTVRTALANSFNVPAVKTLDFVGVYGDTGMTAMAKRLGITSLTREDYGLALTLGGGDVSLLEMTAAFAVFANEGVRVPPVAITRVIDYRGEVVFEYQVPEAEQTIRREHAYLISSILSDNEARAPMFGYNSFLHLPFPAAAKTGTTNDFRDNWTIGYTPDLVAGVWMGNADYTPMVNTTGLSGAAPVWSQFMQYAVPNVSGGNPTPFLRPDGIIEKVICTLSGTEPSNSCREQRSEIFAFDQPPLPAGQDLMRKVTLDTWTKLEASSACEGSTKEERVMNVSDPWAIKWLDSNEGRQWLDTHNFPRNFIPAPERECAATDPKPKIGFSGWADGQQIVGEVIELNGLAGADQGFKDWSLDYGQGEDPGQWYPLVANNTSPVQSTGSLYVWNLKQDNVANGVITLRLTVRNNDGGYAEKLLHLEAALPTPTPEPTDIPTSTPTQAPPTATLTLTPVPPTATFTPTFTPTP